MIKLSNYAFQCRLSLLSLSTKAIKNKCMEFSVIQGDRGANESSAIMTATITAMIMKEDTNTNVSLDAMLQHKITPVLYFCAILRLLYITTKTVIHNDDRTCLFFFLQLVLAENDSRSPFT